MTYPRFAILLAIFATVAALAALAAHYFLAIGYALPFTVAIYLLLLSFSIIIFWLGKRTATADNKFLFSNVFLGLTMVKMFLCGGVIVAYILLAEPTSKLFIVPFFTSYICFTLLEIIALVAVAGEGKETAKVTQAQP